MHPPSDVRIRPFEGADLAAVRSLWNRCVPEAPIDHDRFVDRVLLDPNVEPAGRLVAAQEGTIVGFVLGLIQRHPLDVEPIDDHTAWISLLFVAPDHRRAGIGTALVEHVMAYAVERGREQLRVGNYLPHYFVPGPPADRTPAVAFFASLGFTARQKPVAMGGPIESYRTPASVVDRRETLRNDGVEIRPITAADVPGLIEMLREQFPPDWVRAARTHLQTMPWSNVLVAVRDGAVIGWCQFGTTEPGRFGPYGVIPDERGQGIGTVLFHTCLARMREHGIKYAWLQWTSPDGAAADVYQSVGLEVTREWTVFGIDDLSTVVDD